MTAPLPRLKTLPGEALQPGEWVRYPWSGPLLVVVVLVVLVLGGRDHLAPGVGPAVRANPVRPSRGMALRTLVHRGRPDLVLRTPLTRAGASLLLLGDGHRRWRVPAGYWVQVLVLSS